MNIIFNEIRVQTIETNSGIYIGKNNASNFNSHSKTISGIGSITGTGNIVTNNVSIIYDQDETDTPVVSSASNTPPERNKAINIYKDGNLVYPGKTRIAHGTL